MIISNKFTYKPVERITRDDGVRHYVCPETNFLLPSATTILSGTGDKSGLLEWRARVGDAKADMVCHEAQVLGTLMHTHVENHITGQDRPKGTLPIRKLSRMMSDLIIDNGLIHVDEVWGQEVALYHAGLYAGTTDLTGVYKGKQAIMDHKSAKKMKKRADITDYFLQLAAYAMAHDDLFDTRIEIGVIFMADRLGQFEIFEVPLKELEQRKDQFLKRVEDYCLKFGSPEKKL